MVDRIIAELGELEKTNNISVLYACESGSRAWGFKSPDSDFDVRFIYAHTVSNYLSITDPKDVIDLPVNELLDIGGWDIKKALKLFLKSNSPLYEWLQSSIVYKDNTDFASDLKELMPHYYSLRSGANHYLSMAINTIKNDLQDAEVNVKRYFYAFRSTLACKWIIEKQEVPPMEFSKLRTLVIDESYQLSIDNLLNLKAVSDEKTLVKAVPALNEWLYTTIEFCKQEVIKLPATHNTAERLNLIFRKYLPK